jgi:hypothetical protein
MANNPDNPRRDPNRPEDNPFIAFRRFADSQVSSLLNTVFTLPATIANYNNAHQAREQCLFGKADPEQCRKLRRIEADIADLHHGGREAFRDGDMQAVLRHSEELIRADRLADEIRRNILSNSPQTGPYQVSGQHDADVVERVANAKGQEWGWMWDWGFPKPFDHENRISQATSDDDVLRERQRTELILQLQAEARRLAAEFKDKGWNDPEADMARFDNYSEPQREDDRPRVWSWSKSWQWPPPPADTPQPDDAYSPHALEQNSDMDRAGIPWRAAYEDLMRAEQSDRPHCMRGDEPMGWGRRKIPITQRQFEEVMERDLDTRCPIGMDEPGSGYSRERRRKTPISQRQLEEVMERDSHPRCPSDMDEPTYEYSHDHEDQHDDPPTPRQKQFTFADDLTTEEFELVKRNVRDPEARKYLEQQAAVRGATWNDDGKRELGTEMDVYEQLDATSSSTPKTNETKPSILSTLTTTERTVASDGSITTTVVLKKRFANGREESTETVHTQRGQGTDTQTRDPWRTLQTAANNTESKKNGSGWFWSS